MLIKATTGITGSYQFIAPLISNQFIYNNINKKSDLLPQHTSKIYG